MKKIVAVMLAGLMLSAALPAQAAPADRGGFMGFVAGFCFGVRAAGAYNEGKEIHWREWITLLVLPSIWNGIEAAQGKTTADYAKQYGSAYY